MGKRRSPDHWIREGDVIGTRNESRIYLLLYVFYSTVNGTILNRSMVNVTFFIYIRFRTKDGGPVVRKQRLQDTPC